MKKLMILLAAIMCCTMFCKAEIVSRDTVAYTGEYRLDKIEKTNDYGEVSVRYVCFLMDVVNKKGEPRKLSVNKATYLAGKITHIVYHTTSDGSRKIAKAIYVPPINE